MRKSACDSCHKKKIQCDVNGPDGACDWCQHHGLPCTFDRIKKRRDAKQKKRRSGWSFAARLERLEAAIAQNIPRQSIEKVPPSPTSSVDEEEDVDEPAAASRSVRESESPVDQNHPLGSAGLVLLPAQDWISINGIGQVQYNQFNFGIRSYNGTCSLFSEDVQNWISLRSGEKVTLNANTQQEEWVKEWAPTPPVIPTCQQGGLPSKETVEVILSDFISSVGKLIFPMVDGILFKQTIALAYEPVAESKSHLHASAKASVLAFLSVVQIFKKRINIRHTVDGSHCASLAHKLLPSVLHDRSLVGLQTYVMLHIYFMTTGSIHEAEIFLSLACRLVCGIGGHLHQPTKPYGEKVTIRERTTRQIRILFWMCYIFDKDISLRHGQPPLLTSRDCDLTMPEQLINHNFYMDDTRLHASTKSTSFDEIMPHLPGDPRLSCLKEKIHSFLYSTLTSTKTEAHILYEIRELDGELEAWRLAIPSRYRPTFLVADSNYQVPADMRLIQGMRHITLHLDYYYLLSLIHRTSERCRPVKHNAVSGIGWNAALQSSSAIALEASRSTIIYMKSAVHRLASEAFWVFVFYPTISFVALFFNILNRPLDPRAVADLQLLSSAVVLIKSLPAPNFSPAERMRRELLNDALSEFVRVAQCAVVKAGREKLGTLP